MVAVMTMVSLVYTYITMFWIVRFKYAVSCRSIQPQEWF